MQQFFQEFQANSNINPLFIGAVKPWQLTGSGRKAGRRSFLSVSQICTLLWPLDRKGACLSCLCARMEPCFRKLLECTKSGRWCVVADAAAGKARRISSLSSVYLILCDTRPMLLWSSSSENRKWQRYGESEFSSFKTLQYCKTKI